MNRLLVLLFLLIYLGRSEVQAQTSPTSVIFPLGQKTLPNFTGNVWVHSLVPADTTFNLVAGSVTFAPGARSYWHTHNAGQILLITDGTGYTQEKGKPIRVMHKGEVVICPPHVEHWHGAGPNSPMSHVSLIPNADKGVVTWLRPVTDEEYKIPKANH